MKVLILGSGGREHALAHAMAASPRLTELFIAPGNAGTQALAQNLPLALDDGAGKRNRLRAQFDMLKATVLQQRVAAVLLQNPTHLRQMLEHISEDHQVHWSFIHLIVLLQRFRGHPPEVFDIEALIVRLLVIKGVNVCAVHQPIHIMHGHLLAVRYKRGKHTIK